MEQKMVGHLLKWWAQAYQTNHGWHLSSTLYLHTDTDTCMRICILTADYTVNPILSDHSKKKTNYCLMQVKSIAECSKGSILQYFQPSWSYYLLIKIFVLSILSSCLRHVLLYWLPTCTFCFVEFVWISLLKGDFFTTKKDGYTWPFALGSDEPYFEIMGQWPGPTINLKAC